MKDPRPSSERARRVAPSPAHPRAQRPRRRDDRDADRRAHARRDTHPHLGSDPGGARRRRDGLGRSQNHCSRGRAAALIALGIVAVVVALVGAEARRDLAILVAVGAAPRARRGIAAARAGLVALLAGVIAVPAGFLPVAAIQWSRIVHGPQGLPDRLPIVVPWSTMALVALAVSLMAALFAAATSRHPKALAI